MKISVVLTVFLLFFTVAAAYLYLMSPEMRELGAPEAPAKLLELEAGDRVSRLVLRNPQEQKRIELRRRGDQWQMTQPLEYGADSLMVEGLLAALTLSRKTRRFLPEGDWSQYGLQTPDFEVGVATEKHPGLRTLLLGDAASTKGFIYAKWRDEADFFLLDANFIKAFDRSAYAFLQKRIFRMPLKRIEAIAFETPRDKFEIIRGEENWLWAEPILLLGEAVKQEEVENLLAQLQALYVKEFVRDPDEAGAFGLGLFGEGIRMEVRGRNGEDREVLELGTEKPEKDAYYARLAHHDGKVFYVSRRTVLALTAYLDELTGNYLEPENAA